MSRKKPAKNQLPLNVPAEIWALQSIDPTSDGLVLALDTEGDPFLCFASREDALEGAKQQWEHDGIVCEPVRLK